MSYKKLVPGCDISETTYQRLNSIYTDMKQRCNNPKRIDYKYYGGKGIKVCIEWRKSLAKFSIWALTHGYSKDLTLDRIDSDKDYSPENCRWVDRNIQQRNRSQILNVTIGRKTMCLKDWCNRLGLDYNMVYMRYKRGKSLKEALEIE
jgi:hypothetical protein